jgi:hypothetical protein
VYVWIQLVAIRQAARPERRSIADTHEVKGAALRGGLLVRRFWRFGQEKFLSFDVDEDVALVVAAFKFRPVSLVDFAACSGNFSRVEAITSHSSTRHATDRKTLRRIGLATPLSPRW